MRFVAGILLAAAVLLGGYAGWSQMLYNPRQACDIVGGFLTADGRCLGTGSRRRARSSASR